MEHCSIARLAALRTALKSAGAEWYYMTTLDPHGSEYLNGYYKEREYFSGFTGSNGDLLVGIDRALLWTDGRYFVQAERELDGSGIELMREGEEGVPTVEKYLREQIQPGETLFADGRLISARQGQELRRLLREKGAALKLGQNLTQKIWLAQPALPPDAKLHSGVVKLASRTREPGYGIRPADSAAEIRVLPKTLYEESFEEKLEAVRGAMRELGARSYVLTKLDDQMWLYNIRGNDIAYNPVAYAYSIITLEDVTLYVKDEALTGTVCDYGWSVGIALQSYHTFYDDLSHLELPGPVLLDTENCNALTLRLLQRAGAEIIDAPNPTEALKAVKKGRELELLREVYRQDSAVLAKFLRYIKERAGKEPISELEAQQRLDAMRRELPGCRDLSFTTISAYGANAAMMHYEATEDSYAQLESGSVYLVDSGGQYDGGTTDVTRTLLLGDVSATIREHFTRTAIGMLALQNAVFLKGCTGRNLDILARRPMWEAGLDYKCGTGHGVGYMLNVHEGPQSIRPKKRGIREEAPLEAGMLISDEPGVYVAGSHGIRLENILLVVEREKTADGTFLGFEPLTWVPIDLDGIYLALLSPREKQQLNDYHAQVREKLSDLLQGEDRQWLEQATRAV